MSDRLLSGLVHDLRGRATAFGGLARLLEDEDADPQWFLEHFGAELARLEQAVELLSLLREDPARPPEPLVPAEALPTLLDLWSRLTDGALPVELHRQGEAPPVRVSWPGFRRGVLILLHQAEARARREGAGELRVELGGGEEEALLAVAWGVFEKPDTGGDREDREGLSGLSELFESLGGRLVPVRGEGRFEVRFPALGTGP